MRLGTALDVQSQLSAQEEILGAQGLRRPKQEQQPPEGVLGEMEGRLSGALEGNPAPVLIVTTDLFYDSSEGDAGPPRARAEAWRRRGAVAVEMEAATLFTLGGRLGVATACLLAVSDTFEARERRRISDEDLADAAARMGAAAAAALEG